MKTRIISGVIIAVLILGLGFPGSYPLWLMCLLCGVIGYMELTAVMCNPSSSKKKGSVRKWNSIPDLIAIPGLILTVVYYAGMMYMEWRYGLVNQQELISAFDFWTLMILALDFLLTMAVYVYTFPRRKSSNATGAVAAFLYMPVLMAFVARTRCLPHGIFLYLLIFICASVSDVCALLDQSANVTTLFLIIGICGSFIGQTGDLAASAIKRNYGIKDYGTLIPGHGGIMDRFDSIIFTAPVIYYLSFLLSSKL